MSKTQLVDMTGGEFVRLKWFNFSQNNSGGEFIRNDVVCEEVFFQASHAEEAIQRAQEVFAPYSDYCECCGERWSYWVSDSDGTDEPRILGEPITQVRPDQFRGQAKLHYFDGHVQTYTFGSGPLPLGLQGMPA